MYNKRLFSVLSLILILTMFLAACAPAATEPAGESPQAPEEEEAPQGDPPRRTGAEQGGHRADLIGAPRDRQTPAAASPSPTAPPAARGRRAGRSGPP